MIISVALTVRVKSSSVFTPVILTEYPWMIPFVSSGGGGTQNIEEAVAFLFMTETFLGDSLGSVSTTKSNNNKHTLAHMGHLKEI